MAHLSPADAWPRHQRPQAAAALEEARLAGWWFRPSDGHIFGRLRCRPPAPGGMTDDDACKVPIFSTSGPADGSETARVIREAVRKCSHSRTQASPRSRDSAALLAGGRLDELSRLAVAATALLYAADATQQADIALDDAVQALEEHSRTEEAEALERHSDEMRRRAASESSRALAAATSIGRGVPWPPGEGAAELVEQLTAGLDEVEPLLAEAEGAASLDRPLAEYGRLRDEVAKLSSLLVKLR